jgi:integrase
MENRWIENWLSLQENPRTRASYQIGIEKFSKFCKEHQFNGLDTIVHDYRAARDDDDRRKLAQYTDAWADVLQEYTIWLKQHHAPATVKNQLAILQSFFKTARVPIEVNIPKRAYVTYPKQNLKRKTLRLIISRSTVRKQSHLAHAGRIRAPSIHSNPDQMVVDQRRLSGWQSAHDDQDPSRVC